ncbi:ABC transporter permease [Salana multivorans]
MTTYAAGPAPATTAPASPAPFTPTTSTLRGSEKVTFARLVRSEWIKLISLRSTWWTLGLTILGMVGMSALMAVSMAAFAEDIPAGELDGMGAQVVTFGFFLGQITVAVLGGLVVTGEYTTGMIRSTFTAAPNRITALTAKALVVTAVVFVVGIVGGLVSWLLSTPILPDGVAASFSDPVAWRALAGLGAFLALVALMAFALGVIVRSSAGAIASVLGVLLMLPLAFNILTMMGQEWASTVMRFLPSEASAQLMSTSVEAAESMVDYSVLTWWQGGLVLIGYVVVLSVVGGILVRSRDA